MIPPRRRTPVLRIGAGAQALAAAVAAALLMSAPACAARLGHSRIVSAPGQPLKIDVPLVGLDAVEQATLKVSLAQPEAWKQAGLKPPVSLDSMHVRVTYGAGGSSRLIEISSNQPFDGPVADLLLGVSSAEGEQRYQISILSDARGTGAPVLAAGPRLGGQAHGVAAHHAQAIRVRRGDTMFAIARRNAVPGVTVYQMMIALQRANPGAFIHHNLNLVKAGATLVMPDKAALTAVSDREARRLFMQQVREFDAYRQRLAGESTPPVAGASAAAGRVSPESAAPKPAPATPQDRVVLSSGASSADRAADQKTSTGKAEADSRQRITELEQNIHHLNQALKGGASGAPGSGSGSAANGSASSSASASGTGGGGSSAGGIAAPMLANAARGAASSSGATGSSGSTGSSGATGHGASSANVGTVTSTAGAGGPAVSGGQGTPQTATAAAGHPEGASGATSAHDGNMATAQSATQAGNTATTQSTAQAGHTTGAQSAAEAGGSASGSTGVSAPHGSAGTANADASGASGGGAGSQAGNAADASGKTNPAGKTAASGAPGAVTAGNGTSSSEASTGSSATNSASTTGASNPPVAGAGESAASNKSGKNVSWIQEHMLGVVTALLALIVLIIAWVLRRINAVRDDGGNGPRITEAMVQEKLDQINLDLRQSGDGSAPAKD